MSLSREEQAKPRRRGAAGESVTAAIYYTVSVKKRLIASAVTAPAPMPEKVEVFCLLPPD